MSLLQIDSTFSLNDVSLINNLDSDKNRNQINWGILAEIPRENVDSLKKTGKESHKMVVDPKRVLVPKEKEIIKVQCSNCDKLFSEEDFVSHVCEFDSNRQLIKIVENDEEKPFEQLKNHPVFEMLKNNIETAHKFISSMGKEENPEQDRNLPATYQCHVCRRKFVRESGLVRHMDRHLGELLPHQIPDLKFLLGSRCMCGELFGEDKFAFEHIQTYHLAEKDEGKWIKPASPMIFDDDDKAKIIHSITKQEENDQDQINNNNECNTNYNTTRSITDGSQNEEIKKQIFLPGQKFDSKSFYDILKPIYIHMTLQCEFCEAMFADTRSLLCHTAEHNPVEGFRCNRCELNCLSLKLILLHRLTNCVGQIERRLINSVEKAFICNVCYEEYGTLEALIDHRYKTFHFFPRINWITDELFFMCEYCCQIFGNCEELVKHYDELHKEKPKKEKEKEIKPPPSADLQQNENGDETADNSGTKYTSTKYRQYLCEICGKSYTQSSHLWQHLRFHKGVKPFACNVEGCDRKFTIRPDLNDHIRKCHTGERPFHCTICGKRFLTGSVFYQHRLIHRGERRYGCDDCGKRFYRADALKNHQRIHTGEKPFACIHCPKSFRQRGDRDKHMKARHPDLPPVPPTRKPPKFSFGKGRSKNNTACNPTDSIEESDQMHDIQEQINLIEETD